MNIQGLQNKTHQLVLETKNTNPDMILLNEHHLPKDQIELTSIPEYTLTASFNRKTHNPGGSITKQSLKFLMISLKILVI